MESQRVLPNSEVEALCSSNHKASVMEKDGILGRIGVIEAMGSNKKASVLREVEVFQPSMFIDGKMCTTPDCKSELKIKTSLSWDSQTSDLDSISSPQTPKEDIFDPFAPGDEEKMCLAPRVKKHAKEVWVNIARKLEFGDLVKEDSGLKEEEMLLETMYESFLDAIVAKETESVVAAEDEGVKTPSKVPLLISIAETCEDGFTTPTKFPFLKGVADISEDGQKTPSMVPLLTGIADTCPAPPKKLRALSRKIDMGLCRKLEF